MHKSELCKLIREEIQLVLKERIEVVTKEYELSHGKSPAGTGQWAFRLENTPNGRNGEIFWPSQRNAAATGRTPQRPSGASLSFAQALKLAMKEAKEEGANYIVVMP
jgi:hypothetical protein